jgi:signal transduction histidine kinase/CheY-like chemotaxis protein
MRKPLFLKNSLLVFLFTFFVLVPEITWSQTQLGRPFITNYSYQDYPGGPTNWWAIEGDDGIMYFGNGAGILQFDGVNWELIEMRGTGATRCFAKDDQGVIYAGGIGDLGYLEADEWGKMRYVSLVDKIPEEHREFGDVWEVDYYKGKLIFRTEFKLYSWDGQTMQITESEDAFHVGKIVHDKYYLRIWNRGLCVMEDYEFKVVPGGEIFADERVYVILPYDEERLLIGTRTMGFFIYDGQKFHPFKTEIDELIDGTIYLPGAALPDGRFIVNSFNDGAFLIDREGKLLQKFTTETGMQTGSVDFTYVDSRGVLWMPLFNGISSVDLNSPFTVIDTEMGLEDNVVYATHRLGNMLYMSTNNGIFYLMDGSNRILQVEGTFGQGGNFFEAKGRVFTGTGSMGVIELTGTTFEYVVRSINYNFRTRDFLVSKKDPNRIYVSHQQGLASLYFDENEKLTLESETREITRNSGFGNMAESPDGDLWMTSDVESRISLIKIPPSGPVDLSRCQVLALDSEQGLQGDIGLFLINDDVYFFSNEEISYVFDYENHRFEETKFFFDDHIVWNNGIIAPITDSEGRIWFGVGSGLIVASQDQDGKYQFNTETFNSLKNRSIFRVFPEKPAPDGTQVAWLSGPDGIVRYQGNLDKPYAPDFDLKIRAIRISGDSLLYGGGGDISEKFAIGYDHNSVSLSYAAPIYINQSDVEYSTFLEGLDDNWSDWSKTTTREYINLPPGKYTFQAKARNLVGKVTEPAEASFSIIPPWYRTWFAYFFYVVIAASVLYTVVRTRTQILLKQQKELEEKVARRTSEVQQRLDELATINNVSTALTQKLETSELIKLVGDQMKKLFKSDITFLAIHDPENNMINFPYQQGDDMEPIKFGEGLTSRIIQTGEPLLINKDKEIDEEYNKAGIVQIGKNAASFLGVPIPVENKVIGVLSVQSTKYESRFTEEDKRLLSTIAINVGVALHNAELFEEAKQAKAKAEDANEAKSAFLSTVSHELRTPLTSVLGFAKIIRKRLEDKIFPAVSIDEIESGRMEWHMKPIFLQDVINRAIAGTASLFEQKQLDLKKKIPEDLPVINGDQDKLIQVVINLLSNAVKFTDKGSVTIEAYQDKNQIIVEVQDTGIGIEEGDKHKIFERFRQAGDTLTDKPQGTGLGLPICREIIEYHGGIIWMKSEPNVGSTFFFSMPVLGEGAEKQPIELNRIIKTLKKQIKHSSLSEVESTPTILVVDDDTPIRSLLRQELSEAGYQVEEAANGKAALDMVRLHKPDLIILDVMMPEINGFDVAAVLKNDPATMDIPIIILSIVQDKERGYRIGVDRYLTKPINTEKLFHEVDELLEQGVSKKKVMLVDEDTSAIKSLSDVLSARGYKVLEANSENLLETATIAKPDIIMLNSVYNGDQKVINDLKLQKGMENVMFFVYQ